MVFNKSLNQSADFHQFYPSNISINSSRNDILHLIGIFDFKITINSIIDKKYLTFKPILQSWTDKEISIYLNFTYPQLLSTGQTKD